MAKIKIHFNFFRSGKFRKFLDLMTSRSFLGSILFATALWIFTSLNEEYITYVEVPFNVQAPENMAVESRISPQISLKVRGTGWQLFNLMFFNSSAQCNIDLAKMREQNEIYHLTRNDILKNTEYLLNVEPIDVDPESITLTTGKLVDKKVPVKSMLKVLPRAGFLHVNDDVIVPDSVVLTGSEMMLRKIKHWPSKQKTVSNLFRPASIVTELSDSLSNQLSISAKQVKIGVDIQQKAEMTYHDIEVKVKGGTLPSNHRISPGIVSITIRAGVHELAHFQSEKITAYVNYKDLLNDSTGVIVPTIEYPKDYELLNVFPRSVNHRIVAKNLAQMLK